MSNAGPARTPATAQHPGGLMRLSRIAAAALLAASAAYLACEAKAEPGQPGAAETKAVRECMARYRDNPEEAEPHCLFRLVAEPCTARPENQANLSQADCYRVEAAIWDELLNETYRELRDELDKEQQAKLREMQQAWIVARDRTCEFYHHKIRGSMAIPMAAACLARETHRRAALLKAFGGL